MVNYCRVLGCHNRSDRESGRQYYRLPEIITREGEKTQQLSSERRRLWLAKLNQDFKGKNLKNIRVCSDHFVMSKLNFHMKILSLNKSSDVRLQFLLYKIKER